MIYINGRFLTQQITGVQRFALEISKGLELLHSDMVFLVPDLNALIDEDYKTIFNIKEIKGGGGHYWEQVTLPLFLKKKNNPVLINLCNTAPILYKNQIVTHHDVTYVRYPQSFPLKFRLLYRLLTPIALRNARKVITVSEFSKEEICSVYKVNSEKIHVIHNAVSSVFTSITPNYDQVNGRPYLLAVSSQNYHKNFQALIEAFIATDLKVQLKIIGHKNSVFSNVEISPADERVLFLGRVDDKTLTALYQNARGFVFPSLYEGFGIPPLEAQACGCPVASSDRASMQEVLANSVIYFDPENKVQISNAIRSLVEDYEIRQQLVIQGYKNVKRFSWNDSAKLVDDLVKVVCNEIK
ncbi:glycosyltransferase family 4 protein [Raoultella terrigena]|uniref:glycosyltransferase family 4 protein n=1 Tax=Raoultella terrigena TaxID=577 RepID=UPI003BAD960C